MLCWPVRARIRIYITDDNFYIIVILIIVIIIVFIIIIFVVVIFIITLKNNQHILYYWSSWFPPPEHSALHMYSVQPKCWTNMPVASSLHIHIATTESHDVQSFLGVIHMHKCIILYKFLCNPCLFSFFPSILFLLSSLWLKFWCISRQFTFTKNSMIIKVLFTHILITSLRGCLHEPYRKSWPY